MIGEARKRFKTYVNILSTIKNENNEKYLILRKRYYNECPVESDPEYDLNVFGNSELLQSPGSRSGIFEHDLGSDGRFLNELRSPPPYKPPPKVMNAFPNQEKFNECIDEFRSGISAIEAKKKNKPGFVSSVTKPVDTAPELPPKFKLAKDDANYCKQQSSMKSDFAITENKENDTVPSVKVLPDVETDQMLDKQISVKEATRKFNRIASEEEASKIISPSAKKRPDKVRQIIILHSNE